MYELKIYKRFMCHDNYVKFVKFDYKLMGQFKTDMRNFTIFDSSTQKSQ